MKVLHTADIHFGNKQNICDDILRCSRYLINTARKEKPDLIIIAGDVFDGRVSIDSDAALTAIDFILGAGSIAPTLILKGTLTHDIGRGLLVFENLNTPYPVYVSQRIEQVCLSKEGFFTPLKSSFEEHSAVISCLPSVQKGNLLALKSRESTIEDSNHEAVNLLREVLQSFGVVNEKAKEHETPTILVGHGSIIGASLPTGQQMIGREVELGISDLRLACADLYCLGHIHKAQYWNEVFYAGSLTRLNYGEEEEKGFFIHEILKGRVRSRFIPTPARAIKTIRCDSLPTVEALPDDIKGASLRITYSITEEEIHKVDEEELRRTALEKGAQEVKIEKTIIPKVRVRAEGISRLRGLDEKIMKWAETVNQIIPQGIFEKLIALDKDEEEVIRSYTEEEDEATLFKA